MKHIGIKLVVVLNLVAAALSIINHDPLWVTGISIGVAFLWIAALKRLKPGKPPGAPQKHFR